jgi:tRNA A37 threonylcarbamoyladenosine dehydratase
MMRAAVTVSLFRAVHDRHNILTFLANSGSYGWPMNQSYLDRFGGLERLYGTEAQQRFAQARVGVIGLGGVGSWAVEALARSGIGALSLWDLDDVCVSNTNRQLCATQSQLGQFKVQALAQRCLDINPEITVASHLAFITPDSIPAAELQACDIVIDAIDSVGAKVALIDFLVQQQISFIMTGGAGGQIDPLQVRCADLSQVTHDPLAARVRQQLRRHHGFARMGQSMGVRCVYSTESLRYAEQTESAEPRGGRLNCSTGFGASMMVTATFAMVAVAESLNQLQGS